MSMLTCTCQQTLRADTVTDTKADSKKHSLNILCCTLLLLWLVVAYHGDRQLDCSWPLTCALCFARSDFIVGNMRWVQERVHGWGKEAPHTVGLHIFVSPWAFSSTQLSTPPLSGAPSLGFLHLPHPVWYIPAGHNAWVVPPPTPILCDWRKEKAEKCKEGLCLWWAQCERWWWRHGCDAYLPLTHIAVIAQQFTIWWSTQQPGEDASLTCHLDWIDKHRGWTDLGLTLSIISPISIMN